MDKSFFKQQLIKDVLEHTEGAQVVLKRGVVLEASDTIETSIAVRT